MSCDAGSRRFLCPKCRAVTLVGHPGLGRTSRFALATILALIYAGAPQPGDAVAQSDLHRLATGRELPASERARSGRARWRSWIRWVRSRAAKGATVADAARDLVIRVGLFPIDLWISAAVSAHAREATAM